MNYLVVKRLLDVVLSLTALLIMSPLIAICMLLIYIEDGGNPIYKQQRIGENGVPFTFYKLRTMRVNADKERGCHALESINESDGIKGWIIFLFIL